MPAEDGPQVETEPEDVHNDHYRSTLDDQVTTNPSRKLLARGARLLSNTELLTVVLGGNATTARRVVRQYGLAGLREPPPGAFRKHETLGPCLAARMLAVCELARRAYGEAGADRQRLSRPQEVHRHVRHLASLKKEHLVGLYLDAQNGLIHEETVSVGSLNTTRTHPREILQPAIAHLSLGFILAHNHPSGSVEPSPEDVEFTRSVARAGEIMGIELYDHVIVAASGFVSLRERGLL
jgi:DNA repair protein RadC